MNSVALTEALAAALEQYPPPTREMEIAMNGISIRKGAYGEVVTVVVDGRTTVIDLDEASYYNKSNFLIALVTWALEGYKGNPPILKK